MTKGTLDKRISALEQQAGHELPEVKLIQVDHVDYLEKQIEIEQAESEGFHVIALVSIGVNDETERPDYYEYCQSNHREEKGHGA